MSATTATWGLVYPTGTDQLCDFGPVYVAQLAAQLDSIFTTFNNTLDRLEVIPYASVAAATPSLTTQIGGGNVVVNFDTVNADNYGWTNLAIAPSAITVTGPAANGAYILMIITGIIIVTVGTLSQIQIVSLSQTTNYIGNSPTNTAAGGALSYAARFNQGVQAQEYFSINGGDTTTLPSAGYAAFAIWMTDVS